MSPERIGTEGIQGARVEGVPVDGARVDAVFAALGDGTRRDLLRAVADLGPTTATRLAADRDISRQAVAKHLGVLDRAGLVVAERQGRETQYRADPAAMRCAVDWIDATGAAWDRRLHLLTELFEERG